MINKIELVGVDNFDPKQEYDLLKITEEDKEYLITARKSRESYEDIHSHTDNLINKEDMTDREFELAAELFMFLWYSENGMNTQDSYENLEEAGFNYKEIEDFYNKFNFGNTLDLSEYDEDDLEDNGVEIYWDYLCRFNLKTCNFFGGE